MASGVELICVCGVPFRCAISAYNRAQKRGYTPACSRECGRKAKQERNPRKTPAPGTPEGRAAKAAYDREYRAANRDRIRMHKRAAYLASHEENLKKGAAARATVRADPDRYAAMRTRHNAHCSRPEYKAAKAAYDSLYTAKKRGGENMTEAVLALRALEAEIIKLVPTRAERESMRFACGRRNHALMRKRRAHGRQEE